MEHAWRDYRRGLRAEEQVAFDALFRRARAHASASGNAGRVDPLEAVFMSVLLEHEQELARLREAARSTVEPQQRPPHPPSSRP